MLKLSAYPLPVVTAINGPAVGAGVSLALLGDIVLAARSAYFMWSFVRIGIVPDCGTTWLAVHSAGLQRALELMMLGEKLPAEQALAWGMIYQMHEDAALLDEAHKMAARLAGMAGHALVLIRKSLRASAHNDYNTQLDLERDYQGEASRTPDHKEGVAAFLEKRAPKFSGKQA